MGLPIVNPALTRMHAGATRGTLEGLALQETCRKKFYELERQLGICLRYGDALSIRPKN